MTDDVKAYRLHCFGRSWVAHGNAADVRRYLDHLNYKRPTNLISAQLLPNVSPHHGEDIAAELAKLDRQKEANQ